MNPTHKAIVSTAGAPDEVITLSDPNEHMPDGSWRYVIIYLDEIKVLVAL